MKATALDLNPRQAMVCLYTFAGFLLGMGGLLEHSSILLLTSLLVDATDGALARHLGADSDFGKHLDYAIDVTLAGAIGLFLLPMGLVIPVAIQVLSSHKYSGRSIVTLLLCASWWLA